MLDNFSLTDTNVLSNNMFLNIFYKLERERERCSSVVDAATESNR